jgi:hypothetical protein
VAAGAGAARPRIAATARSSRARPVGRGRGSDHPHRIDQPTSCTGPADRPQLCLERRTHVAKWSDCCREAPLVLQHHSRSLKRTRSRGTGGRRQVWDRCSAAGDGLAGLAKAVATLVVGRCRADVRDSFAEQHLSSTVWESAIGTRREYRWCVVCLAQRRPTLAQPALVGDLRKSETSLLVDPATRVGITRFSRFTSAQFSADHNRA